MKKYLLLLISLLYIGCGEGSSEYDFRPFLYKLFTTQYFWKDEVSQHVEYYKYKTPQEMIDDLKYKPKDRWSTVVTKEQNSNFLNQKSSGGFGFAYGDMGGKKIIVFVRIDSPADIAGIRRGDILLKIDDKNVTNQSMLDAIRNLDTPTNFLIYRASIDKNLTIPVQSREYTFKVTLPKVIKSPNAQTVGYLRLDSFTAEATEEIDEAFTLFKSQNIDNLVVDMRYNGGGSIVTASILLDKLMRDMDNEIQFSLNWNAQYQSKNKYYRFETDNNSLNLNKIVFLTTKITASASELVINALKPYKGEDVVIVGDTTHGKPVGMEGKTDGVYIYYLVNFVIANSDGFYDYFGGLQVSEECKAPDDLNHQLGDSEESMLKKALYFIDNGGCL